MEVSNLSHLLNQGDGRNVLKAFIKMQIWTVLILAILAVIDPLTVFVQTRI